MLRGNTSFGVNECWEGILALVLTNAEREY